MKGPDVLEEGRDLQSINTILGEKVKMQLIVEILVKVLDILFGSAHKILWEKLKLKTFYSVDTKTVKGRSATELSMNV